MALNYFYYYQTQRSLTRKDTIFDALPVQFNEEEARISNENPQFREDVFRFGRIELDAAHRAACKIRFFFQAIEETLPLKFYEVPFIGFTRSFRNPAGEQRLLVSDPDLMGERVFSAEWQKNTSLQTVDRFLEDYFENAYFIIKYQLAELGNISYLEVLRRLSSSSFAEIEALGGSSLIKYQGERYSALFADWQEKDSEMNRRLEELIHKESLSNTYKVWRKRE